jgi:hypothetical protein
MKKVRLGHKSVNKGRLEILKIQGFAVPMPIRETAPGLKELIAVLSRQKTEPIRFTVFRLLRQLLFPVFQAPNLRNSLSSNRRNSSPVVRPSHC